MKALDVLERFPGRNSERATSHQDMHALTHSKRHINHDHWNSESHRITKLLYTIHHFPFGNFSFHARASTTHYAPLVQKKDKGKTENRHKWYLRTSHVKERGKAAR
jgi:hypothetical protein